MTANATAKRKEIRQLYYITHIDNLASILKQGIFSHSEMERRGIKYTRIYDEDIVRNRASKYLPNGKSLWDYANVYFQPRNPMMYRVKIEKSIDKIAVLGIRKDVLARNDFYFTSGNAASAESEFYTAEEFPKHEREISRQVDRGWWNSVDGSKRQIMAECLFPNFIEPGYIEEIYVANNQIADGVRDFLSRDFPDTYVLPDYNIFFEPLRMSQITGNLSVIEGDMFFSRLHTLTVSVNCVGVMGKGLASRAKYQFPDVYVRYQDVCRSRELRMGRPYLYKRESSFDCEIADEPNRLTKANAETWFLLFPTKQHWRNDADIRGIEEGLVHLSKNYHEWGIKSLAIPALGCGLGRLNWSDVGPLMCKYLSSIDIPVQIYLPTERVIPDSQIQKEFLLSEKA